MKKWLVILCFTLLLSGCGANTQSILESITNDLINTAAENALENVTESLSPSSSPSATLAPTTSVTATKQTDPDEYDYILDFPSDSYPETALHIYNAIENGHSDVCTIDREGADENRKQSLKGIQTQSGYDRDEWPMAMCQEGGEGADIAYISPSDNRGAGSWVGNQLSAYENGEKVLFIVAKPKNLFGDKTNTEDLKLDEDVEAPATSNKSTEQSSTITYKNCAEVREAGAAPLFEGEPGYSKKLDRDGDGIACEI